MRAQIADLFRILPTGTLPGGGLEMLQPGVSRLAYEVDRPLRPETLRRAETIADHLAALGAPPALTERALDLFQMDGAAALARWARQLHGSELDVTHDFPALGVPLGVDREISTAPRPMPTYPGARSRDNTGTRQTH